MEGRALNSEQAQNGPALVVVVVLCLGLGGLITANFCLEIHKQIQQRAILRQEGRDTVGSVTATHAGHEADPIAIRYLPSDPTVNHPADWEWSGLETMDLIPEVFMLLFTFSGSHSVGSLVPKSQVGTAGWLGKGLVGESPSIAK
jgi:hypothetical protein